jgi:hypothetical protein
MITTSTFQLKNLFTFLILLNICTGISAQDVYMHWARVLGGTGNITARAIAVDNNGNVFTTGSFTDTADVDPGNGTVNLISPDPIYGDFFVSKLNVSGDYVNAYYTGGLGAQDYGNALITDAANNVFTAGYFHYSADFDPDPVDSFVLTGGSGVAFVSKFDANNDFVWASKAGISDNLYNGIALDDSGNVYTTGKWSNDIYISKRNAQGDTLWNKRYPPTTLNNVGYGIAVDDSGYVYVTGYYWGLSILPNAGNTDVFVMKLDANGSLVWAKGFGGTGQDFGNSLVIDKSGGIYITGSFSSKVDFNPGTAAADTFFLTSAGGKDVYVAKLNSNGQFQWATRAGGILSDVGASIAIDTAGNTYITGNFSDTAVFGSSTFISTGGDDAFVAKLNSSGNFTWTKQFGGDGTDASRDVKLDASGNIFLTGYFAQTADLDPESGVFSVTSEGLFDVFVIKLSQQPITSIPTLTAESKIEVYPNPFSDQLTFSYSHNNQSAISLYNFLGQQILQRTITNSTTINTEQLANGIYFYELHNAKGTIKTGKVVKQ